MQFLWDLPLPSPHLHSSQGVVPLLPSNHNWTCSPRPVPWLLSKRSSAAPLHYCYRPPPCTPSSTLPLLWSFALLPSTFNVAMLLPCWKVSGVFKTEPTFISFIIRSYYLSCLTLFVHSSYKYSLSTESIASTILGTGDKAENTMMPSSRPTLKCCNTHHTYHTHTHAHTWPLATWNLSSFSTCPMFVQTFI